MSNSNFLILTCDGGGIRGLITAMLLQKLDKELGFLKNKKIDLFAGTSSGGLIALGLASGVPISKIVKIYNNCSKIFTPYTPLKSDDSLDNLIEELANNEELDNDSKNLRQFLKQIRYVKYNNTGLKTVLQNNLAKANEPLAKLESKVLVTTFQLHNSAGVPKPSWRPITLDNLPKNEINSQKTSVLDAALCTSAAPIYFPPHIDKTYGLCVDGGVFANDPGTLTLARVISSGILEKRNMDNIRMLSIGTGKTYNSFPSSDQPREALRYGILRWLWPWQSGNTPRLPLLSMLMDGSSIMDDFQTQMFLGDEKYRRINIDLTETIPLDECSKIEEMERLVSQYTNSGEWRDNINWIKDNFQK